MKVRFATVDDLPALIDLGRRIHAESRFRGFSYDPSKLLQTGQRVLNSTTGTHCCFVAEASTGKLAGVFVGCVEEYFFSRDRIANSILIFVDPAYRGGAAALKLIHAFRTWALNRQAIEVSISIASGVTIDRTDRFLKRIGLKLTGGNYALSLASQSSHLPAQCAA